MVLKNTNLIKRDQIDILIEADIYFSTLKVPVGEGSEEMNESFKQVRELVGFITDMEDENKIESNIEKYINMYKVFRKRFG